MRAFITGAAVILLASSAQAGSNSASFAFDFVHPGFGSPSQAFNILAGSGITAVGATPAPGAAISVASYAAPWVLKLDINGSATQGVVFGSATSVFALNQTVTGAPGTTPTISYTFGIDGSFAPGDAAHYPAPGSAPAQTLTFFLLAYAGTSYGFSKLTDQDGDYLYYDSSNGHNTLSRGAGTPGYSNTMPAPIAAAAACFGADTRCYAGGSFNDQRTINVTLPVGTPYTVLGYLYSATNGRTDFFNTAKLLSVSLDPQFDLVSQDGGALLRSMNGSYSLASVPEPASWLMLIAGFGLAGAAQRRQRARLA